MMVVGVFVVMVATMMMIMTQFFEVSHPRCVLFNTNITMYELVRTQLYLNIVHGVVIYYQLHVSASILASIL